MRISAQSTAVLRVRLKPGIHCKILTTIRESRSWRCFPCYFLIGALLVAEESRTVARRLDGADLRLRRLARRSVVRRGRTGVGGLRLLRLGAVVCRGLRRLVRAAVGLLAVRRRGLVVSLVALGALGFVHVTLLELIVAACRRSRLPVRTQLLR